jgi:hypothetical protein
VDTDGPPPSSPITEPFMPQQCSKLQKRGHPAGPQEFLCDVARNVRADRSSSETNQLYQMQDICSAPDKAHPVHYTFFGSRHLRPATGSSCGVGYHAESGTRFGACLDGFDSSGSRGGLKLREEDGGSPPRCLTHATRKGSCWVD